MATALMENEVQGIFCQNGANKIIDFLCFIFPTRSNKYCAEEHRNPVGIVIDCIRQINPKPVVINVGT
jgi:hypothetical protein